MTRKVIFLSVFLALISCSSEKESGYLSIFREMMEEYNSQGYFNGSAEVYINGDKKYELIKGKKNIIDDKIDKDTQFFLGTSSVEFTVVALFKALNNHFSQTYTDQDLIFEEIIHALNNPISVYLDADHSVWHGEMPSWARNITVLHLLSNNSGLVNYLNYLSFDTNKDFFMHERKDYEILGLIRDKDLLYHPGVDFNFSATNYFLLSLIIEKVSGKKFDDFIKEEIFLPASMKTSSSNSESNLAKLKNRSGYRELAEQLSYNLFEDQDVLYANKQGVNFSTVKGVAGIISTSNDIALWHHSIHESDKIISKKIRDFIYQNHNDKFKQNFGYGSVILDDKIVNYGEIDGFKSYMSYIPKEKMSIIILTNVSYDKVVFVNKMNEVADSIKIFEPDSVKRNEYAKMVVLNQHSDERQFLPLLEKVTSIDGR